LVVLQKPNSDPFGGDQKELKIFPQNLTEKPLSPFVLVVRFEVVSALDPVKPL